MAMASRQFFEQFVRRSFEDFCRHPEDEYLAMTAATYANVMAGRLWHYYRAYRPWRLYGASSEIEYRDALSAKECKEFGPVREMAEGSRRLKLKWRSRGVSAEEQADAEPTNWTDEAQGVTEGPATILLELDDGSRRSLRQLLTAVVKMLDQLSSS